MATVEAGVVATRMTVAEVTVEVGVADTLTRADGTATTAEGPPKRDGTTATSSSSHSRSETASVPAAWWFYKVSDGAEAYDSLLTI